MKKFQKLIGIILCLTMVLSSFPLSASAMTVTANRNNLTTANPQAKIGIDYLGKGVDGTPGAPADSAQTIPTSFAVNDVLWFGVYVENMTTTTFSHLSQFGFGDLISAVNYDSAYLTPYVGTGFTGIGAARFQNAVKKYSTVVGDAHTATSWCQDAYEVTVISNAASLTTRAAETSDLPAATAKAARFNAKLPDQCEGYLAYQRFYQSTDASKQYLFRFPMKLTAVPGTDGAKVIELALTGQDFVLTMYDDNGTATGEYDMQWDSTGATNNKNNFKAYFQYLGDPDVFPAAAAPTPTLQGAPAITGTAEYGATLNAGAGTLAASDASAIGTVTYSWYDGENKLADGDFYTVGKGLVGKTITLKATAANCDGTQSATTAAVAAKALTPSGSWTVQDKTYDGATTATITGTPTVTGLTGDTVSVTGTAAFASADANNTATVNITGIKLTGADAANYKLDGSYATTATATAKIDKKELTLNSTNQTGKVDVAVELAGAVTDSGKVGSDNTQVTYSYALKTTTSDAAISGTKLTAANAGTYTVIATATTANSNYKFITDTKDFTVTITEKAVTGVEIVGSLNKTEYTVGDTVDLSGIQVKVTYNNNTEATMNVTNFEQEGGSFTIGGTAVTNGTTAVTAAMNGKAVTATMSGKTASTTQTLTVALPTLTITVTEQGIASKVYDGTTAADSLTKAPSFSCNRDGATVDTTNAVYTYAQSNVGTNIAVHVTGLKVGTETATYTGKVANGTIAAKELTLAAGTAKSGKVNTKIDLTGAVVANGAVGSDDIQVSYEYTTTTTGATISVDKLTATNAGTVTVTATATTANNNYKFITDTKDFTVTITEKAVTGVEIVGSLNKTEYTVGDKIDLSGIKVKVTYDNGTASEMTVAEFVAAGGSFSVNGTAVTDGTTEVTADMNGKKITAAIGGKSAETGALTVAQPTLNVTVETQGAAVARQYDGTTGNVTWTTAPVFKTNITGKNVDATNAVYTYAQANVGTGINITVTGLKVDGEAVTVSGTVGTGDIKRKALTVTAKSSVKTKASSKVTDFITVEGLVGSDTAAGLFDGTTWTNGTANDKGVTLTINTGDGVADIPLAKGEYTLDLAIDTTTFEGANANYTVTDPAITGQTLKATKTSGGGGGGAVVTTPTTYTVTFKAGTNGSFAKDATTSVKVEKDSTLASKEIPSVTAKSGYKFIGWSLDGKTVVDPTDAKVTKAVTYTALYKQNLGDHAAYMNGNEKGQFMPDANITRAEAAALLARLVPSYKEDNTYTGTFGDVKGTEWFANEVFFDVENGYITGYEDGTFKPTNNITRQEFAIIVARYLGMENEGTSSFADCNGVYAEGYISQLVAKGILNGYEDGTFRPNAYITRAEATKVLNGVFDRVPDQATIDEAISNYNVKLTDVSKRHWAYYEILEAAIEHEIGDFHK